MSLQGKSESSGGRRFGPAADPQQAAPSARSAVHTRCSYPYGPTAQVARAARRWRAAEIASTPAEIAK
jgi:hypothetical protein